MKLTPTEFQNTLNELNAALASANDPWKSCFDNCLAILTLYISPLILSSHYERVSFFLLLALEASANSLCRQQEMKKFDRILERANRDVFNPAGLNILSPRRNAFLFVSLFGRTLRLLANLPRIECSSRSSTTSPLADSPSPPSHSSQQYQPSLFLYPLHLHTLLPRK